MELSNNNPYWSSGDIIVINGQDYTVTGAGNNASIGNIEPSSQYIAMFPKSCYVSDNGVNSISFKYPTEQTLRYNAQGEQLLEAPMCAYAERNARALEFKNLGSILRLNVTNNGDKDLYIKQILIQSSQAWVSGNATIADVSAANINVTINSGKKYVLLDCQKKYLARNEQQSFFITLPPIQESSNKLTFTIIANDENNNLYTYTRTQTSNMDGSLPRNQISTINYNIAGSTKKTIIENNIIQTDYNISNSQTAKFTRGNLLKNSDGSFLYAPEQYYITKNANPNPTDLFKFDATLPNDGNRLPTAAEFRRIETQLTECQIHGIKGYFIIPNNCQPIVEIKRGTSIEFDQNIISDNEWIILESQGVVFLPSTGYIHTNGTYYNTSNMYWTSTSYTTSNAYMLVNGATGEKDKLFRAAYRLIKTN